MISRQAIIDAAQAGRGGEALTIARSYAPLKQDLEAWFLLAMLEANYGSAGGMEQALRKVLELQPDHPDANYNLGVLLQGQKRSVEAIACYRTVLRGPFHAEAAANLGLLMLEAGDEAGALTMLEQAVAARPDLAEAQLNVGIARLHAGRIDQAEIAFRTVLRQTPNNGKALHSLGLCAEMKSDFPLAEKCYRDGIEHAPAFIDSYVRLGRLMALRGETHTTRAIYEQALHKDPRAIEVLLALGHLLSQMAANGGDYSEAEACYHRALAINPQDARIQYAFGWIAQNKGETERAVEHYRRALTMQDDYQEAMAGLSSLLERQGRFEEARNVLVPALASAEPHSLVLLAEASLAKNADARAAAAARLTTRAAIEQNPHWLCDIHFALGKLRDELGQYDEAFVSYAAGNALERRPFDADANDAFFDRIIQTYSREAMPGLPRARNSSKVPVFIVGMPRSGTSLIEQILASHPQVFGAGELTAINYLMTHFDRFGDNGEHYPAGAAKVRAAPLNHMADQHLALLARLGGGALRVTDKMPHNFICLGLIEQLFPGARIIHCRRDPVDTCLSIFFQHFNTHHPYANDLEALGRYYRQYERLMQHWRDTIGLPLMEIQYEELVADQETLSRKLIEFCELPWDDACLSFFSSGRTVNTPSYDQVRKPIYKQSVARWKKYEAHLAPLLEALGERS